MSQLNEMKRLMSLFESNGPKRRAPLNENLEDRFADDMSETRSLIAMIEDQTHRAQLHDLLDRIGESGDEDDEDQDEQFYETYGDLKKVLRKARKAVEQQPTKYVNLSEIDDHQLGPDHHEWDALEPGSKVVFMDGASWEIEKWFAGVVSADKSRIEQVEPRAEFN